MLRQLIHVGALCVAVVAGFILYPSSAHAAACSPSASVIADSCPDQGAAYAAAWAAATEQAGISNAGGTTWCPFVDPEGANAYVGFVRNCKSSSGRAATKTRSFTKACSTRPEETGWKGSGAAGTGSVCHNGCAYEGSVYAGSPTGRLFTANGQICKNTDLPAPETPDPGDGDGGGSGEIPGDGGGGGDGGGDGSGPGNGGGDGGGGNGDGDGGEGGGDGDGDGDGDGNGEPGGEQPNIPSPEYEGDIPFPWLDGQIPSSSEGQWSSGLGNGSCPATKSVSVGVGGYSTTIEFSFKPLCDFAILIRGLVLAISAVVSAYIIAGVRR